ncbi:MAG: DUF1501 domain-containing protein [Planctomycetaceae bacterium]|nr:DUF1501 domain-containing protein [Planctomycetaceae bacterium]
MLSLLGGRSTKFCDNLSRRNFLQIGGLALGGLSLPELLRAESTSGQKSRHKGIIMVFLPGGPPHQDMWDLKMDAPTEIRGPFSPIATNVPGIEIGELFPRMAQMSDKFAYIRSIVGAAGPHYAFQCLTGKTDRQQPLGGWPAMGSYLSKLMGSGDPSVPAYVGLSPKMGHMPWADNGQSGFLGISHAPFKPHGEGREDMVLNGITTDRLSDRKAVLGALDRFRREVDASGMMEGLDSFTQQAFGILTSSKLAEALDLNKEDVKLRDRYGRGVNELKDDGGPRLLDNFLVARRLIEAGVRCVTLAFSRWDWHGNNFGQARTEMPMLDQALTALIEDLEQRGMLDDVPVVCWGEFGRTPKINTNAGRDHWPQVSCAVVAGGRMKTGQVIGQTNRLGEYPTERPVHFQEVHATLYKAMGIDIDTTTVRDLQGRPRYLVDHDEYRPMKELV